MFWDLWPSRPCPRATPQFTRLGVEPLETREVPATLLPGFRQMEAAFGITGATAMDFAPDGRLFVASDIGVIQIWKDGVQQEPNFLADTPITTDTYSERGLLGLAFDPDFATNGYLYIYYTTFTPDRHNRVSRFEANATRDRALSDPGEEVIWEGDPHYADNHNGGAIHFGPDGKLYIATGDNAYGAYAQDLQSLHGKILRINKDGTIPADNPFVNQTDGKYEAIWTLGLRNPFTFAFEPGSNRMFINDVGENTWEEINNGFAGGNYGWPGTEGRVTRGPSSPGTYSNPIYAYPHSGAVPSGFAVTGGTFYNPPTNTFGAAYARDYFFSDFASGWIYRLDYNPSTLQLASVPIRFASGASAPVDLKTDSAGNLYFLSRYDGKVIQISAFPPPAITQQPADYADMVGKPATFSVAVTGDELRYQWQRADSSSPNSFTNIAGANSATFTIASLALSDNNDRFRVVITNPGGSVTSNPVRLLTSASGQFRLELENLTLSGFVIEYYGGSISGGRVICLKNGLSGNQSGTASGIFPGPDGYYQMVVGYYDENDGVGTLAVSLGGTQVDSWALNQNRGSDDIDYRSRTSRTIGIFSLTRGEAVQIAGTSNPREYTRVDFVDFIPVRGVPVAPATVVAKGEHQRVKLTWNASAVTSTYNVYGGTVSGQLTLLKSGLTDTTYTDPGLVNGTRYYYQVTAVNPFGESVPGSEVSAVPTSLVKAINAGGGASGTFQSDSGFSGGSVMRVSNAIDTSQVADPAGQSVYQTWRLGDFSYTQTGLNVGTTYRVRLHFAENHATGAGQRVFNVNANGTRMLSNVDVFAEAGGQFRAIAREFTVQADSQGRLILQFVTVVWAARLCGIEIYEV